MLGVPLSAIFAHFSSETLLDTISVQTVLCLRNSVGRCLLPILLKVTSRYIGQLLQSPLVGIPVRV